MKPLSTTVSAVFLAAAVTSPAASLLFDFGPSELSAGSETNSPGHAAGVVPAGDTVWNEISSGATTTGLSFGDSSAATGVSITMGQESSAGSGTINLDGSVSGTALAGTGGGTPGQQSLLGAGSIYGEGGTATVGRDGLFNSAGDSAIGLTIDGLSPGIYEIFAMARNTNSNSGLPSVDVYSATGSAGPNFAFDGLTPSSQANSNYSTGDYEGEFTTHTEGETHIRSTLTVGAGESLFLAVDGAGDETRGFINSMSVTRIPEPSSLLLGFLGLFPLARRRR